MFREPWIVMLKLENHEPNGPKGNAAETQLATSQSSTLSVSFLIP